MASGGAGGGLQVGAVLAGDGDALLGGPLADGLHRGDEVLAGEGVAAEEPRHAAHGGGADAVGGRILGDRRPDQGDGVDVVPHGERAFVAQQHGAVFGDLRAVATFSGVDPDPIVEAMWWHPLNDRDPGHRWLRDLVAQAAEDLDVSGHVPAGLRREEHEGRQAEPSGSAGPAFGWRPPFTQVSVVGRLAYALSDRTRTAR